MGSAFDSDPTLRGDRRAVCMVLANPDLVAHFKHKDCPIETPHTIDECGRFLPVRTHLISNSDCDTIVVKGETMKP